MNECYVMCWLLSWCDGVQVVFASGTGTMALFAARAFRDLQKEIETEREAEMETERDIDIEVEVVAVPVVLSAELMRLEMCRLDEDSGGRGIFPTILSSSSSSSPSSSSSSHIHIHINKHIDINTSTSCSDEPKKEERENDQKKKKKHRAKKEGREEAAVGAVEGGEKEKRYVFGGLSSKRFSLWQKLTLQSNLIHSNEKEEVEKREEEEEEEEEVVWDLLYAPRCFELLLTHGLLLPREEKEGVKKEGEEKEEEVRVMYYHCGGSEGNDSQLRRYQRLGLFPSSSSSP